MKLLDKHDLAQRLKVHHTTIDRWRAAGRLPKAVVLASQSVRWREEDIAAWIEARIEE